MKKSSAITFSILILLIVLAVLLGLTAFFIDQTVVYPLVLMTDTEVNLKCFLSLINLNNQGYIREGNVAPEGTLRSKLTENYKIIEATDPMNPDDKLKILGYGGIFTGNEEEFRDLIQDSKYKVLCYTRSFGPAKKGYIAIYGVN